MKLDVLKHIDTEMNKRKISYKLLLLTKSGSHLYGTNTPESDEDYLGVFIPLDLKYYLGFHKIEEVDLSIKDKDENGKNTKEAVDIKLYDLRKFIQLASQNNPNIVELLFAHTNKEAIIFKDKDFKVFENNVDLFLSQRVQLAFLGYAKSQLKKGRQKPQNYNNLIKFKKFLENLLKNGKENDVLGAYKNELLKLGFKTKDKDKFIQVSNLTFPLNFYIKKVLRMVNEKLQSASHRAKSWETIKYDSKFFMHLFRLIEEGTMLIKERKLEFPLRNKEFLIKVRNGKFTLEELEKMVDEKVNEFEIIVNPLPKKSKMNKLEELTIDIIKKNLNL